MNKIQLRILNAFSSKVPHFIKTKVVEVQYKISYKDPDKNTMNNSSVS